jgi:uncharacterized protein YndB with AHSA1/START domain
MKFTANVLIDGAVASVWRTLTDPVLMKHWMGDTEMEIEIDTTWTIGSPIIIRGFHHVRFENRGEVLEFEKEKKLSYTHLSSVSRLPDVKENYSVIEFMLEEQGIGTLLTIAITNFPTESIRKHMEFYWRGTTQKIKHQVESHSIPN